MFQLDVVEKCKANDRKAQLKLYSQYCDGMFAVAMRFLRNVDDAEDVLQDAFINAFQKIHQYSGEVTFGAWLKRIVVNKCIDFLKTKKQELIPLEEGYLQPVKNDDWSLEPGISIDEVKQGIQLLPEKYKYVVLMFLVEGFDHHEISQVLSITEPTSRTRLLRGKAYLKSILIKQGYGTGY